LKDALDKLHHDLDYLVYLQGDHDDSSNSRYTREYLQDGRFLQNTREEAPSWAVDVGGRTRITPAGQWPGNGLTELIVVYLLVFGDPEPLIEKLHPDPDKLDREKLRRVLHGDTKNSKPGLFTRVEHAARLIRGADVEGGANTRMFDVQEQIVRLRILQMREAGHSDEEIIKMLLQEGTSISMAYLKWLAGLALPDPTR